MRYSKTLSISEVLNRELKNAVSENIVNGLEAMHVVEVWRQVLGDVLCRYSCDERFDAGRLTVRITSSVLRNDLFLQRTTLVQRVNDALGEKKVHFLQLL